MNLNNKKTITRPKKGFTGLKAVYHPNIAGKEEVQIINYDSSRNLGKVHVEIDELEELIEFLKDIREEVKASQ